MSADEQAKWHEINLIYSTQWPVITQVKPPLPDHEKYNNMPNKYEQFFSPNPGQGDK